MSEPFDLTACEREPISIPGSIQPHGLMLVLRGVDLLVVQVSANSALFLNVGPDKMLGQPVGQWFDDDSAEALRAVSRQEDPGTASPLLLCGRGKPGANFDGILHRCGPDLVLELERLEPGPVMPSVRGAHLSLQAASTEDDICRIAARETRRLTGFDRVVIYRFAADWSGEVVAEDRTASVDSYLGTHFPASDIPKQARELYTRKLLGLIPNINYSPVQMLALEDGPPLDMSLCVLRSVSPIHLEYLRNMGVAATLTISLVISGKLWGMIACHHGGPWHRPYSLRQDCQFLGQVTSAQIGACSAAATRTYRFKRTQMLAKFLEQIAMLGDFASGLTQGQPNLRDFIESSGASLIFDDICLSVGSVPSEADLLTLRNWLAANPREPLFATHTLSLDYPAASAWKAVACGLLAVPILPKHGCYALWFRPEFIRTVTWAGDPAKPISIEQGQTKIGPRKSFAAWKETVDSQSQPWTEAETDSAMEFLNTLSGNITGQIEHARATEMRLLANEQKVAKEAAEATARVKGEFLANMSHEIRTPMNGVIGMTDLLLDCELDPKEREFAETIRSSAESLLKIINDILDFSKIEAGKLLFEMLDFDLIETVEGSLDMLAERAQSKGIELASAFEPDMPTRLRGDPGRLRQILINLIGNALKFTSEGEVVIRISKMSETETYARIRFEVEDSGIGISPEVQKGLFQAFSQADASTTRRYGGTGLGLAISKQLVALMEGEIGVRSQPGYGATFWFTACLEKQTNQAEATRVLTPAQSQMRVLVVDDNRTNRQILCNQIGAWKMAVGSAANSEEALDRLRGAAKINLPYNLALVDLQMPGLDGLSLAATIKDDPELASTRLIVLTSMGHAPPSAELTRLGIESFLVKPIKQSRLFDCLSGQVSARREIANPESVEATNRTSSPESLSGNAEFNPARILLAEDDFISQTVALAQLRRLHYQADVVVNGREVLEALIRTPYELIFLDCQMPEMSGYDVARWIRQQENRLDPPCPWNFPLRVIALTAHAMQGEREKCLAAGMDDYLTKPLQMAQLQAALERWQTAVHRTHT